MIEAKNQQGNATDWWFIYKTPERTGRHNNQGFDFFYYDPETKVLTLSPVGLDQDDQALNHTLSEIFGSSDTTGFLVYNDEHVDQEENSSEKGHCKGILAFDKTTDSGLFLLHSTPRFPGQGVANLPEDEAIYGQTFLCITLPDYETANRIAQQMLTQQNPQILKNNSRIPDYLKADEPLSLLFHGIGVLESDQPSTLSFSSRGGKPFRLIAKSRKWGKDFWLDLISPTLSCDLVVETWRRGAVTPLQDQRSSDFDDDVLNLVFKASSGRTYSWPYTKDHAKWATALKNPISDRSWVCVADINRMVSQERRGGGSLCFEDSGLWSALQQAEANLHSLARSTKVKQ